jgi:WD40 repeat protein
MSGVIAELVPLTVLDDCVDALAGGIDGTFAAGSLSGQLSLLDSNGLLGTSTTDPSGILSLAWSPDGTKLIAGYESGCVEVRGRTGHADSSWHLGSNAESVIWIDDRHAAVAAGRTVAFLDLAGEIDTIEIPTHVTALVAEGEAIFAAGNGGVWAWSSRTHHEVLRLEQRAPVLSLAVSRGGNFVATGDYARSVHLWDLARGDERHSAGYEIKVERLAFVGGAPNLVIANWGELTVWSLADDTPLAERSPRRVLGHTHRITALVAHEEGLVVSGAADGSVCVWDFDCANSVVVAAMAPSEIRALAWARAGDAVYVAAIDGSVSLLSLPCG